MKIWKMAVAVGLGLMITPVLGHAADQGPSSAAPSGDREQFAEPNTESANGHANQPTTKASDPAHVLAELHQSNQAEIAAGQLAKSKGQSDAVRQFGQQLIDDHQRADQQVMQVAQQQNIDLTKNMPADKTDMRHHDKAMQDLQGKSGADFDKAFAREMAMDHKQDLKKLNDAKAELQPSPTRDLVTQVIPVIQNHLDTAKKLEKNS